MKLRALIALSILFAAPASAQMVKQPVTASNGIVVDVAKDDFAQRYEYVAPTIDIRAPDGTMGAAFVAKIRRGAVLGSLNVQGFVIYSGKWRYYRTALFKGGAAVNYQRTKGDVGSCRYGCTLTEHFTMQLSAAEISKYAENGSIPVQLRADSTETVLISIPVSYIKAVEEVAK
jgi:hypothetical protein